MVQKKKVGFVDIFIVKCLSNHDSINLTILYFSTAHTPLNNNIFFVESLEYISGAFELHHLYLFNITTGVL